ncbi:MAG: dihydroorotase [Planctomycetota bacterium]
MGQILIKNGRVIDPANKLDRVTSILIADGKIKSIGTKIDKADEVIDAKGLIVTPGLIDMHVHLREPGKEDEETIASGSTAAVAGGFTSIACMPNTDPPIDDEASAEFVYLQAKRTAKANVFPIGAITKNRQGKELAEMGQLVRGGAVAFSDDGEPVSNAEVMRRALEYSKMFNRPIISHCENKDLVGAGVMNEGLVSLELGLAGMPAIAEEIMVHRDMMLARLTGGRLHLAHITTIGSIELIKWAKNQSSLGRINVTAEVTPHHFTLTDKCIKNINGGFDPVFKVNPPLRTQKDIEAIHQALKDGTIDVIASDHAPHAPEEKEVEFNLAPFGMIGMESMLPLVITELVDKKILTLSEAVAKMTVNPARILGISKGTLAVGADADITIIDLEKQWVIDPSKFKSKSRNCPFAGRKVKGKAVKIIVGGKVIAL